MTQRRGLTGRAAAAAVVLSLIAGLGAAGAEDAPDPFEAFAGELIETIDANAVAVDMMRDNRLVQGWLLGAGVGDVTVAVWPFKAEALPVPPSTAAAWNEKLIAALVRKKPGYMRIVTRRHLKKLLLETQAIQAFEEVVNPTETLARNAAVNFLIIGEVRPVADGIELAYKGVNIHDGTFMASTRHRRFAVDVGGAEERARTLPLSTAIAQAAKAITSRNLDIETLEIYGLREEPTKAVTAFSDYFASVLATEIERRIAASLVDFKLKVRDAVFTPASVRARGIPITAGPDAVEPPAEADPTAAPPAEADPTAAPPAGPAPEADPRTAQVTYTLSGIYWLFEKFVDVNLAVQNGLGERVSWTGRVDRSSIPKSLLAPPAPDPVVAPAPVPIEDVGPIGLELSTQKGRDPRFRLGETMQLWIEVKRDAHLNCYYRQADGTAFRFFPNRYMTGGNKVLANRVNRLPGPRMPFKFTMSPPEGIETVHCFATDRPVADKLPPSLGARDLEPISAADFAGLSEAFRAVPGLRISEASMTVTVRN